MSYFSKEDMSKITMVNHWVKELDIKTITEIGCGNNLLLYNVRISYSGYNKNPVIIELCKQKINKKNNALMYYFTDKITDIDYDSKLCLCIDQWDKYPDDNDFKELCEILFVKGNWQYIIIYSNDTNIILTDEGLPYPIDIRPREVLTKVSEYPQWQVKYWISGIEINKENYQFPSNMRFYLLERINCNL